MYQGHNVIDILELLLEDESRCRSKLSVVSVSLGRLDSSSATNVLAKKTFSMILSWNRVYRYGGSLNLRNVDDC